MPIATWSAAPAPQRAASRCRSWPIRLNPPRINVLEIWESSEVLDKWRAQANAPKLGDAVRDLQVRRFEATDGGPLF